jgi:hypothetical protein
MLVVEINSVMLVVEINSVALGSRWQSIRNGHASRSLCIRRPRGQQAETVLQSPMREDTCQTQHSRVRRG